MRVMEADTADIPRAPGLDNTFAVLLDAGQG